MEVQANNRVTVQAGARDEHVTYHPIFSSSLPTLLPGLYLQHRWDCVILLLDGFQKAPRHLGSITP